MATPIKELHDEDDSLFYPVSKTDAIYDNENATLEQRLTSIITDAQWTQIQKLLT